MSDDKGGGGSGGNTGGGGGKGGGNEGGGSPTGYNGAAQISAPVPTVGDNIAAGSRPPTVGLFNTSFDAGGGSFEPGSTTDLSARSNPTASAANPSGITTPASTGGALSAAAVSAPGGGAGGSPVDLTSQPFQSSSDVPLPQARPAEAPGGTYAAQNAQPPGSQTPVPTSLGTPPANANESKFSLDSLVSKSGDQIAKNPLGLALAAGGLGYNIFQGQQQSAATKTIADQAASLNAQGQQLASYLMSGNLPPGLKAQLDQATASAKARVTQNFANQGLSTDPSQNSALGQQLAQIDQQAIISIAQIGQQLLTTGINESGMASDLYKTLSNIDQTQTANIGKAISAFAAAANGGGGQSGLQLKIG